MENLIKNDMFLKSFNLVLNDAVYGRPGFRTRYYPNTIIPKNSFTILNKNSCDFTHGCGFDLYNESYKGIKASILIRLSNTDKEPTDKNAKIYINSL